MVVFLAPRDSDTTDGSNGSNTRRLYIRFEPWIFKIPTIARFLLPQLLATSSCRCCWWCDCSNTRAQLRGIASNCLAKTSSSSENRHHHKKAKACAMKFPHSFGFQKLSFLYFEGKGRGVGVGICLKVSTCIYSLMKWNVCT